MDIELLENFLQGRCTADEAAVVKAALDKDPALLETYLREAAEEAGLMEVRSGVGREGRLVGVDQPVAACMPVDMERALLASFRDGKVQGIGVEEKIPSIRRWIWWPAAAAAVIGIVVTGWLSGMFGTAHDYVLLEAKTTVKQVRLADGSMVWLRPGSRLRLDQKAFGMKERLIELQKGEVFFDVVHDPNRPFIVQTGRVKTTDIGTSFDIMREEENDVVVTVATGEVKVSHDQKELGHVLPGNQVSVAAGTGKFASRVLPSWMAYIWKENYIQLNNVPFDELVMAIQQMYGVSLQTREERIGRQTFTMQLSRKTAGEEVIKVICLFNQNQYRKNADGSFLIY
jgi:ferric-dicitrate binding protein FerR (iron transport regulator)